MNWILDCQNVDVWRGNHKALVQFSLQIPYGQNTAIIGPNGSGKSTLLRVLTRDLYPEFKNNQHFHLLGESQWDLWEMRRRLGIVSLELQEEMPAHLCGRDMVLSGLQGVMDVRAFRDFSPVEYKMVKERMVEMEIDYLAERRFDEMSSGEQRRCLLTRALVHDPDILIFDEPTANLDIKSGYQYLQMIRKLMKRGVTAIVVTHHLAEIPPEIGYIVFMKHGQVIDQGPRNKMLTTQKLSNLFEIDLCVTEMNQFCYVHPMNLK